MDGDQHEPAFLVEPQRVEVIVRCYQPKPRAAGLPREFLRRVDQRVSDSRAGLRAVDCHDLARACFGAQRDESDDFIAALRGKTGEFVRTIDDAVRDDDLRAPAPRDELAYAFAISRGERADDKVTRFDGVPLA